MKAVQTHIPGTAAVVSDAPTPKLRPDYVLVKVHAVALNPTDWKHMDAVQKPGVTLGCDFAGTVEAVGGAATKPWKQGDRIAGFVHGGNVSQADDGAFGEFLVAKADIQVRVPEGMGFEAAAGLGVGIATVGQGLYQSLGLPLPGTAGGGGNGAKEKEMSPILIYGGSSAMGAYGIQWAKL
jgi:NADPH:quinone reductase-like Zn-dependent oxidoreductase